MSPIQQRLLYPLLNEAAKCLEEGVAAEAWMIDLAMVLGTVFAPFRGGPLHAADSLGIACLVSDLESLAHQVGDRLEPCGLLHAMAAEGRTFFTTATSHSNAGVLAHEETHR